MFRWSEESNSVEMVNCCRGHERSVECVGVAEGGAVFSTGGWDNTVKIWSGNMVSSVNNQSEANIGLSRPIRGQ